MLKSCPDAALSYGAYVLAYEGKPKVPVRFRPLSGSVFSSFLLENPIGMHGTVMYRRDRPEEAGGFRHDMKACEDYELYLRLTQKHPVISTSQVLAQYWQHGEKYVAQSGKDAALVSDRAWASQAGGVESRP